MACFFKGCLKIGAPAAASLNRRILLNEAKKLIRAYLFYPPASYP